MKKKLKRIIFLLLLLMGIVSVALPTQYETVCAAKNTAVKKVKKKKKNGLRRVGKNYYCYLKNGKRQRGWVSFKGGIRRYFSKRNGHMVRSRVVNSRWIDSHGIYRVGRREQVERQFAQLAKRLTNKRMTKSQKLRACYRWMQGCHYVGNYDYPSAENRYNGWDVTCAEVMLKTRKGNCYHFACAFAFLARSLGYEARIVSGTALNQSGGRNIHCWVEINGKLYDPERDTCWAKSVSLYGQDYKKAVYDYRPVFYID